MLVDFSEGKSHFGPASGLLVKICVVIPETSRAKDPPQTVTEYRKFFSRIRARELLGAWSIC